MPRYRTGGRIMKVGTIVTHVEYPGKKGRVLAKKKKNALHVLLVKWQGDNTLSTHIENALIEVIGS